MKKITILSLLNILIFLNLGITKHTCQCQEPLCEPPKQYKGFKEKKGELFYERIKKLKEEGIISDEEEKEIFKNIEDLKNYRKEVWADDKLTKEEERKLKEKEKIVREKIHSILEKSKEHLIEDKSPKEREEIFNKRIDNMLKKGVISKKQADELKAQHKQLINLEEEIWSDGAMTRQEQRKLIEQRRKFNEKVNTILKKELKMRKKQYYKKGGLPPANFQPERGHFLPEDMPPFLKEEFFEERI